MVPTMHSVFDPFRMIWTGQHLPPVSGFQGKPLLSSVNPLAHGPKLVGATGILIPTRSVSEWFAAEGRGRKAIGIRGGPVREYRP